MSTVLDRVAREFRGPVLPPKEDGPAVTVERAAELLHCRRAKVFVLLAECRIERAQRAGRKTLILTESVHRFLATPLAPEQPRRRRRAPRGQKFAAEVASVRW